MELLCPAGSLPALKTAVDNGADAVYIGFKDDTNARHFAGLNFTDSKLERAVDYVHQHGRKLHIAINTFAHPGSDARWKQAVDKGVALGADALIIADLAVLDYASRRHPDMELHVSVQASATNAAAIRFYQQHFNVGRVVLPRVLSMHQVKQLARETDVGLEVFAFGSLCIMAEGRCYLSSYMTGESPNTVGACSPAKFVRWEETPSGLESRLNEVLIDRYGPGKMPATRPCARGASRWMARPITRWRSPPASTPSASCPSCSRPASSQSRSRDASAAPPMWSR